eukprot:CCRYP_010590-RE/>CCRYP_010590-RE protein AED:0.46 eAED:1.00 QI:0/0/0/1/0/0/2/0/121
MCAVAYSCDAPVDPTSAVAHGTKATTYLASKGIASSALTFSLEEPSVLLPLRLLPRDRALESFTTSSSSDDESSSDELLDDVASRVLLSLAGSVETFSSGADELSSEDSDEEDESFPSLLF